MTPEATKGFRDFLRLRDFAGDEDPEGLFEALASLIVWADREGKNPHADNDTLLSRSSDWIQVYMGLLLHLATIDKHFFRLAQRMAARTLTRHDPPARTYRHMAAYLLTADPPNTGKPKLARDVIAIIALAVLSEAGVHPTEAPGRGETGRSGCARLGSMLFQSGAGREYKSLEGMWGEREAKLLAAGFSQDSVSEFFAASFRMKRT
ncbi:MAG: hypothetical protein JNK34_01455 [Tabrizicola sp.]|nr:hypothetical protein [Tabrizicola sp.]